MAIYNKIEGFKTKSNEAFLEKAESLNPRLSRTNVLPTPDHAGPLGKGDQVVVDFQDHHVGTVSFHVESVGSPADAPAKLRIRYAERPFELERDWSTYHGEISSSWLQEEIFFVDHLPYTVHLPRRHAFRYVEITVLDTTPKYQVNLSNISARSVSSADYAKVPKVDIKDPLLAEIDRVSLRTMHQCMQSVFEDGPKRDQRLWLGDLRLQALGNYATFKNYDLVKRCLYLFAGMTIDDGRLGACLFHEPKVQVDDTLLFDYSLQFVCALKEYYNATKDEETLRELFPTAKRQIELSMPELDHHGVVKDRDTWWCFIDWGEGLNKQAGAQAMLILALKDAGAMAKALGMDDSYYVEKAASLSQSALDYLYDKKKRYFVSGPSRQISFASQVYFVLAGVLSQEENVDLLTRIEKEKGVLPMNTPYMYHYYVQALFDCGLKEKATAVIKSYWGGMIKDGADTFYEVYDPKNPKSSPYGDYIINSYCHAWSGTPSYFIRTFLMD